MLFLCLYSDKTIGFLTNQSARSILSILKYGLKEGHSFDKVSSLVHASGLSVHWSVRIIM